jgi:hypothetical protein
MLVTPGTKQRALTVCQQLRRDPRRRTLVLPRLGPHHHDHRAGVGVPAYSRLTRVLALTIAEREAVLDVISNDPPAGLEELGGVLLREHVWRQRQGF